MNTNIEEMLLNALMGGKDRTTVKNVTMKHEGTEIILPVINGKEMTYDEAIVWLNRKKEEEENVVAVYYEINAAPLDAAVALQKAISKIYGWSNGIPTPGFFGDRPPQMIGVNISKDEKVNVPWGRIEIPGIEGYIQTYMKDEPHPAFIIGGEVKRKHSNNIKELVKLTQDIIKEDSIYRGKAVKVDFEWLREGDDYSPTDHCPQFMDMTGIKDDDLIFGQAVTDSLDIGLFTPIEKSQACREFGVPLKRGVLLYGPYGTGKTMTAYVAALKAVRNGWTFIYLDSVADLKEGLRFAAQYAPAVIFAEDIDRLVNGARSMEMDEVLNTLDGVDTKGAEIITVLTTNHIESINPAMLRPGRLDTLVEVSPPDSVAAQRLVSLYARGLLADDVNLEEVGNKLEGKIPAFIREVTERAKIAAIARSENGESIEGKVLEVDLIKASNAMEIHASMLAPREDEMRDTASVVLKFEDNKYTAKAGKSLKVSNG